MTPHFQDNNSGNEGVAVILLLVAMWIVIGGMANGVN